jgi:MYXO-CTERM domain-containing protein
MGEPNLPSVDAAVDAELVEDTGVTDMGRADFGVPELDMTPADNTGIDPKDAGCGCRFSESPRPTPTGFFLLVLLMAIRRPRS